MDTTLPIDSANASDPLCIDVLDHGFVRLIDAMGSDLSIVRAARVSYAAAWRAGTDAQSDRKLLAFLLGVGRAGPPHSTPFEAVTLTFEIKAPIFVFRQWHRHRTWSYNELSARYRELSEEFYLPTPETIGVQSTINKQARLLDDAPGAEALEARQREIAYLKQQCQSNFLVYRQLLAVGWPRELARMTLPTNTYSHMFATVNLWNLLHFLTLRDEAHAQYEIRQYAKALLQLARDVCPVTMELWESARHAGA